MPAAWQLEQLSEPRGWLTWKQSTKDKGFPFSTQEQQPVLLLPCSIFILAGLRWVAAGAAHPHSHLAATLSSKSGVTVAHPAKGKTVFN